MAVTLGIIILAGFLLGTIPFSLHVMALRKKYQAYIFELKEQGKYQEWIAQHKEIAIFEKISMLLNVLLLIALFVFFFGAKGIIQIPKIFVTLTGILVYSIFPYFLIYLLITSRLYKVPKDWQQGLLDQN